MTIIKGEQVRMWKETVASSDVMPLNIPRYTKINNEINTFWDEDCCLLGCSAV
jgi:hypothetical protein